MNHYEKQLSVKIAINATELEVFNKVTNWEDQSKWVYLTKVRGVDSDARKLGGKLEAFTGIGKVGFLDTMTITRWVDNKLCEVTHTGNVVKGRGLFEVSTVNSVTYFTWTEYVELPFGFIGRIGWLIVKPISKFGLWVSLRRLKKYIENAT
jgi:hypothetical protein